MTKKTRVPWFDGVRGIACIFIFLHHFSLAFFPAMFYGNAAPSHLGKFDALVSQSPFAFFLNGNFMVAIFCMISGIVISMQVMNLQDKNKLSGIIAKRYFRLMLPVFVVGFLVFILSNLNLFAHRKVIDETGSPWLTFYYQQPISFFSFLRSSLVDTWFFGSDVLSTAFWMLSKMFFGTFICIILSCICWKYPSRAWLAYLFVSLCFFRHKELYFAFALGTLIAWIYIYKPCIFNKYAGIAALFLGLFLGAFPSGCKPTNLYKYLYPILSAVDWHIIGAALTLYGLFSCKFLQKILSFKLFQYLGKISYSVYLIHIPLLFSFTCFLFAWIKPSIGYAAAAFLSLAASTVLLIALSYLFTKYVEKFCEKTQQMIITRCLEEKTSKE